MSDHAHSSNCPEQEGPCSLFWSSLTNQFNKQQDLWGKTVSYAEKYNRPLDT
jgi:hypothetical protein